MLFLKMFTQVAYIIETVARIIKATIFTYSIFTTQDGLPVLTNRIIPEARIWFLIS